VICRFIFSISVLNGFVATVLIVLMPIGLGLASGHKFVNLTILCAGLALLFPLLAPWPKEFLGSVLGFFAFALVVFLNYAYLDAARNAGLVGDDGGGGEALGRVICAWYFEAALFIIGLRVCFAATCKCFRSMTKKITKG